MAIKFTIFLPVRNGGRYFRHCVESILAQTYRDFSLIVLDNASVDKNIQWLRERGDARIKIFESKFVLSIEENWARIIELHKNEYMTIIGHDDLFDSNYLEVMCDLINKCPSAGLYQTHFRLIDENGRTIRPCLPMKRIESSHGFLTHRFSFKRDSFGTGYMFRSADYEKIGGIPLYKDLMFADDALWMQLMSISFKVTAKDECFSYRIHAGSTSYAPDWRSLYEALGSYLDFLSRQAEENKAIRHVLESELQKYIIFWFQCVYFSKIKNANEKLLESEIYKLAVYYEGIAPGLFKVDLKSNLQKYVFGRFSRFHWFWRRSKRWVGRKFLYLVNLGYLEA